MKILDMAVKAMALKQLQTGLKEKKLHIENLLDEKISCKKMIEQTDMFEDDVLDLCKKKMEGGRSIEELEEQIEKVKKELDAQASEPLKNALLDRNYEHDWQMIAAQVSL
jgi:translation initiation factor 2B subunit (eIF-2B alpha/beta/delta family)